MLATKNFARQRRSWTWPRLGRDCRIDLPDHPAHAEPISLQALVTPSTVIRKGWQAGTFALHGFIEFQSLAELFPYIEVANSPLVIQAPSSTEQAREKPSAVIFCAVDRKPSDLDGR